MSQSLLWMFIVVMLSVACKPDKPVETALDEDAEASCFLFATDRDTVFLKLNPPTDGKVTGDLRYDFYERDGNVGYVEGEIRGDTLIADYTFLSEGMISVREVGF